jgi:Neuraminidase (sialidase)
MGRYLYWDIHYMQSPDGGQTWRTMESRTLTPPVIADDRGPADRISLDDEFEVHTWLSSFLVKGGKAHFLYLAQSEPARQHYVRYDLATGRREIDRQPEFRGDQLAIRGLDGFFATRSDVPDSPLFCISRGQREARLVCLVSDDNGATWRDYAVSQPFCQPYAIGGCREVTPDGWIIGSFTDVTDKKKDGALESRVHFFRVRVR